MKGNLLYGQSGGPTTVINATAYGVIKAAFASEEIEEVYAMRHGIMGALNDDLIHVNKLSEEQIELLPKTPGAAFGSVRYKIANAKEDETDYVRLLYIFKKYNIRYFLYNGGNDSMDTCYKISEYMRKVDYDIKFVGLPKTIDNDLPFTDHTPGFGSAAKYIANTIMEIHYDMIAYPKGKITIVEIMGRHAGWLTASSAIASLSGYGPDLIYLPEIPFDIDQFKQDVQRVYEEKEQCLVAVSEGIMNKDGDFISSSSALKDAFGHFQLGGVAPKLANIIDSEMKYKARSIELSTIQRSAAHLQSLTDVTEAIEVGKRGVAVALDGESDVMITMKRKDQKDYEIEYTSHPLKDVANVERVVPKHMINKEQNGMTQEFFDYVLPLIQGEYPSGFKGGIQQFSTILKNS
ncbi:MAG: 6-phosphofructokinase [Candidatus Izemoplasmataceae bacterium]